MLFSICTVGSKNFYQFGVRNKNEKSVILYTSPKTILSKTSQRTSKILRILGIT